MISRIIEGKVLSATQEFLDDLDSPLLFKPGYPRVSLVNSNKDIVTSLVASPTSTPGNWIANLPIPEMQLTENTEFSVKWKAITLAGEKLIYKDSLIVEPLIEERTSDIVALFGDQKIDFVLPTTLNTTDNAVYQIYANNEALLFNPVSLFDATVNLDRSLESCRITIPLVVPKATLYSNLLKIDILSTGALVNKTYLYNLWAITPQLLKTMLQLEDFLNKSRIENVIPELRWTAGDLIGYLERGLNYFNMIEKPTFFTGMNMQGALLDAHLICSEYYALSTQLIAEGSLAFDFSGQGISLNVDRTPQLDSALGRIEALIDSRIVPLKKELVKNGITNGDGSIGSTNMNIASAKGVLTVMNAATTRISTPMSRFLGRRR